SAQGPRGVARCRGRPRDGAQRTWQDRRHHWHPEDGQIRVQQAQGTSVADAGDGWPPVYPLFQSEQIDARPSTSRQVRRKRHRNRQNCQSRSRREGRGRPRCPCFPQGSFATRSNYHAEVSTDFSVSTIGNNTLPVTAVEIDKKTLSVLAEQPTVA